VPPIVGRQGIVDFYRSMFQRVRERPQNNVTATDETIELDAVTRSRPCRTPISSSVP
jgi:hypothetical protein